MYPIAASAMDALTAPLGHERTQAAARRVAGGDVRFETEWMRPGPERAEELQSSIQAALSIGAAQIYESEKGRPVIALKFWRVLSEAEVILSQPVETPKKEEHTDDLYFRRGRTKARKKPVDPNQLDLFPQEKQPLSESDSDKG
ncbi:MAG: hypothetical protein CMK06_01080 [Ponticaulis sp.]|nr:hypothetical protein [Ponticaulis sp.]